MDRARRQRSRKKTEKPEFTPSPVPEPPASALSTPQEKQPEPDEFMQIGGSPVPGLTLRRILRGHTSAITRIAWSPDGQRLASPSEDQTIRIWAIETGDCLSVLTGNADSVFNVAWSPNGRLLASAGREMPIRILDIETGKVIDVIVVVGTPVYKQAWERYADLLAADADLIRTRLRQPATSQPTLVPLLLEGDLDTSLPRELRSRQPGDFRDETHDAVSLYDLVLTLYAIPLNHPAFEPLRQALQKQWEETLSRMAHPDAASRQRTVSHATATAPGGARKEVFISYAWGGESEAIANQLDQAFQARGVTIVRDKRDLGFKGRIKAFMENIGQGKCVVLVISERYLKSENCLFELLQVAKHGDFAERIFPVVLEDARIYKPVDRLRYVQHWEQQLADLDAALKTVSAANLAGFHEDIDLYAEIRTHLPRLADILKDMNTLTPTIHRESDFAELYEAVMAKLAD